MDRIVQKTIAGCFYALAFFTPLILFTRTSEIFEFNKMVFVYVLTIVIASLWAARTVLSWQIIFKRSLLTIPILLFVLVQAVATYFSINMQTSLFGFHGRYHGGLLSTLSFALLFFAFVSNVNKAQANKILKIIVCSATIVALYGIVQKFGIDKTIWTQDVQSRVFSTLGQPNWLAAFLVAVLPVVWAMEYSCRVKGASFKSVNRNMLLLILASLLLFVALVFTRSRSGMLGFIMANLIFWPVRTRSGLVRHKNGHALRTVLSDRMVLMINMAVLLSGILIGLSWLYNSAPKNPNHQLSSINYQPITSTFETRKIIWAGATDIWKESPLIGTGPETFGYTYFWHRPVRHNQSIEWQHLFNKAHNEYLNFAANSGAVGLLIYLTLVGAIVLQFIRKLSTLNDQCPVNSQHSIIKSKKNVNVYLLNLALLAGLVSILVTNFFGFSVVVISLLFFLYPAISIVISDSRNAISNKSSFSTAKVTILIPILLATCYLLLAVGQYWYSDYLYAQGKKLNAGHQYVAAVDKLKQADALFSSPVYSIELADALANLALQEYESHNNVTAHNTYEKSRRVGTQALIHSPYDISLANKYANVLVKLTEIDSENLDLAKDVLENTTKLAPTDPWTLYNLGVTYSRTGDDIKALKTFQKSSELKPDYIDPRLASALLWVRAGNTEKAIEELEFILNSIDPADYQSLTLLQKLTAEHE